MTSLRNLINEAAVLGDTWTGRLGRRDVAPAGLAAATGVDRGATRRSDKHWQALGLSIFLVTGGRPGARKSRRLVQMASTLALVAAGVSSGAAWARGESARLNAMLQRLGAISVVDAAGTSLGAVPRRDALVGKDATGRQFYRVNQPVASVPSVFMRAARGLEGEGIIGISPPNLVRSSICSAVRTLGMQNLSVLRLRDGKCAGASTLLAQAVRSLTDDREAGVARKLRELASTMAVATTMPTDQRERFIADTLFFGNAEGQPIIGLGSAARTVFGAEPAALEPYELAYLSALLRFPARLGCGGGQVDKDRFAAQIARADVALRLALRDDPQLIDQQAKLRAMQPITAPAPDADALAAGLDSETACRANTGILARFEALDSSLRQETRRELATTGPAPSGPIRLTVSWPAQMRFKNSVERGRAEIAAAQHDIWFANPAGPGVTVLAFTTDPRGGLTGLYQSGAVSQLTVPHELGSLAKLPALAILAEQGWGERRFCNKAARLAGKVLHDAGGDSGVTQCGTGIGAEEVWGRSLSLAVYDALKSIPAGLLRARLNQWRISIPTGLDPAYATAFGLVSATPADFAAFTSSLAAGNVGRPALGYPLHLIETDAPFHPAVDLKTVFAGPGAAALIARAAGAALSYRGPHGVGTLLSLGPTAPGAIAKSGTLDDGSGQVRYKAASGGLDGATWTVMIFPQHGALGTSAISIVPLAKQGQTGIISGSNARYFAQSW